MIDPESGLDDVRDVGIEGRRVAAVGGDLDGATVLDVSGLAVAPGFIDLHSHAQTLPGRRLQACDGVTTALELEAGRAPIDAAHAREVVRGSPIHYGFSASWAAARMHVMADVALDGGPAGVFATIGDPAWQGAASETELSRIVDQLSVDLAAGAIGIGVLAGYAPGVDPTEHLTVARLAAAADVPTFTHCRDLVELTPNTLIDGAEEIVRAAGETGAHMHYCHINSTSSRHIDRVLALIERCRAEGGRVTTEAYPYGSGSTVIGAAFLAPERLAERGLTPAAVTYLPTGERVADDARLRELRATDPAGAVLIEFLDEDDPADRALLRRSLAVEDAIVASDAMPPLWTGDQPPDVRAWPLPPNRRHAPSNSRVFRTRAAIVAGRRHTRDRSRSPVHAAPGAGARRLRSLDADEGPCACGGRCRSRRFRSRSHHRPSHVRSRHARLHGDPPRPGRRDVRRAGRRPRSRRPPGATRTSGGEMS